MSVGQKGDYLRVSKPIFSDGVNPVVINDRVQFKEVMFPLKAEEVLRRKNETLPDNRKLRIEKVANSYVAPSKEFLDSISGAPTTGTPPVKLPTTTSANKK